MLPLGLALLALSQRAAPLAAAPPRAVEGLTLGQPRAAALALPLWSRLCDAPPACEERPGGSSCRCQGPGPVAALLDFAGPGEQGTLARATLAGPGLAWAQKLAYSATAQGEYRELACPDLTGYRMEAGPAGELLVGDARGRGLVELRDLDALPAAWGQLLPPEPDQPLPPLALARPVPETDWYGLELRPHVQLPLGAPAPRPGYALQGEQGPLLDGLRLGALHRDDHLLYGYGADLAAGWLRSPEVHYTLVGASAEVGAALLSPAYRVRPLVGAELGLEYVRSRAAGGEAQARVAPRGAVRAGAIATLTEWLALRAGASYSLGTALGGGVGVQPGGLALELGLLVGLGTDTAARLTPAQLEDARSRAYLARTARRLDSMRDHFRPYGVAYPVRELTRLRLPAGTYRLKPGEDLALAGARLNTVEDYGDSYRAADADGRVVLFLEHPGEVTVRAALPCLAAPRQLFIQRLDYQGWRQAHPDLAAEAEP